MKRRERHELDRHITGNYGEDQYRDEREWDVDADGNPIRNREHTSSRDDGNGALVEPSKHSPGPWVVAFDEPYAVRGVKHYTLEDNEGHQLMLLQRLPEASQAEHDANARLIVSAVNNHQLLIDTLGLIAGCAENDRHWWIADQARGALERVKAAQ